MMYPKITFSKKIDYKKSIIFLCSTVDDINRLEYDDSVKTQLIHLWNNSEKNIIDISLLSEKIFVLKINEDISNHYLEKIRRNAAEIHTKLINHKIETVQINSIIKNQNFILSFFEGLVLSAYKFTKYKTGEIQRIRSIAIADKKTLEFDRIISLTQSVYIVKDLINEPYNKLNSEQLVSSIEALSNDAGFNLKVLGKKEIKLNKMNALLAVNQGSIDPPAFCILEHKPKGNKLKQPIVFVGKGIVYDTGGHSLKTNESMKHMKCDMSGAAVVAGLINAVSKTNLPIWIVGLIPITDNKISATAVVPGDIIEMANGTTVEIMNTDAEGRLILADALIYANKFNPSLVIDIATLTGSASAAIGRIGIVAMGSESDNEFKTLEESGHETYERIVRFPLWKEYEKMIESKVADIKNVGEASAGAITAAKFLEKFISYPWIHLDIAGPSFITEKDGYKGSGATAVGLRLFYNFVRKMS